MIRFRPFRGVRYDTAKTGGLAQVVSPPYDVIHPALREKLLGRSPWNVARVIKADPADNYAGAARLTRQWLREGALRRDDKPAVYVYEQQFSLAGKTYRRTGLIGLVGLDEEGGVLPHERTLSGPKADRLLLLRATRFGFGQIFVLFNDPARVSDGLCDEVKAQKPLDEGVDADGLGHRVWAMSDPGAIAKLQALLADQRLFIADGHHRWETARNYMREQPAMAGARWAMMTLVNMSNPGLVILPTHRVMKNLSGFDAAWFEAKLAGDFEVSPVAAPGAAGRKELLEKMARERAAGRNAFGVCLPGGALRLAVLRPGRAPKGLAPALARLDVTVLHRLILEKLLGVGPAQLEAGGFVDYVTVHSGDPEEVAGRVDRGEGQVAFLLNATSAREVAAVASAGERMPQKATYFYPKVYTGVVMYDLEAEG